MKYSFQTIAYLVASALLVGFVVAIAISVMLPEKFDTRGNDPLEQRRSRRR